MSNKSMTIGSQSCRSTMSHALNLLAYLTVLILYNCLLNVLFNPSPAFSGLVVPDENDAGADVRLGAVPVLVRRKREATTTAKSTTAAAKKKKKKRKHHEKNKKGSKVALKTQVEDLSLQSDAVRAFDVTVVEDGDDDDAVSRETGLKTPVEKVIKAIEKDEEASPEAAEQGEEEDTFEAQDMAFSFEEKETARLKVPVEKLNKEQRKSIEADRVEGGKAFPTLIDKLNSSTTTS